MIQSYQLNRVPIPRSVVHTGTTTQHLPEISLRISRLLRSIVSEPSAQIFLERFVCWPLAKIELVQYCWQYENPWMGLEVLLWQKTWKERENEPEHREKYKTYII